VENPKGKQAIDRPRHRRLPGLRAKGSEREGARPFLEDSVPLAPLNFDESVRGLVRPRAFRSLAADLRRQGPVEIGLVAPAQALSFRSVVERQFVARENLGVL